jgi:hypothetical protein
MSFSYQRPKHSKTEIRASDGHIATHRRPRQFIVIECEPRSPGVSIVVSVAGAPHLASLEISVRKTRRLLHFRRVRIQAVAEEVVGVVVYLSIIL